MDKNSRSDKDEKRIEKLPIKNKEKRNYETDVDEITFKKEKKDETLSKNFKELEKFNTSEIDKNALRNKPKNKKAFDIEKEEVKPTLKNNVENKTSKKAVVAETKKISKKEEEKSPYEKPLKEEDYHATREKTTNNYKTPIQSSSAKNPTVGRAEFSRKPRKKRVNKPAIVALVALSAIVVIFSAMLVYNLLTSDKPIVSRNVEKKEFVLNHESKLNVENQKLSGTNIDLRHSISEFFNDNVPKENFLKAMVYKKGLDGKFLTPDLLPRVESAMAYNDDVVGWLRIKDSNVNMAVVQNTTGNNYYTWKGYDKGYSKHSYGAAKYLKDYGVAWAGAGTSVLGTREDMSRNTVIFGHNWENISSKPRIKDDKDLMFEQLAAYVYTDFANENPYINFSNRNDNMTWVVVGAFYTEDYWGDYDKTIKGFNYITADLDESQTERFIEEVEKRSHYTLEDFEITKDDKFLTLSTCTRAIGRHDRQRFAVVAMLVDNDNLPDKTVYKANENYKKPAV